MVIQDVLRMADELSPNSFSEETKIQFLNEAEGVVQTEVFLLAVEDVITYSWPEDKETELLAEPPHDKLYLQYVAAKIDYANGEYDRYQNKMQMYNAYLSEFMRWFAERYRPADTHGAVYEDAGLGTPWRGYYISAYGIAVKHGFSGTETEWRKSLRGERGETGAAGRDFQIKGYFDTLENLEAAVPEPEAGDTYFVGTVNPYRAYMWDGVGKKWVYNGYLRGPAGPQGIQGEQGIPGKDGEPGKDGKDGKDGYTPQKGVDYFDGAPGKDGKDGEPGKDGYTPVKGVDYFDGKDGEDGKTPVKGVDYFDGKDGYTPQKGVDYFDGAPGKDGKDGEPGKDGYTPVKGVDYFDGKDGEDGKTPVKGVDYFDGKDGYTPQKGVDYFDGEPGKDGKDGRDGYDGYTPIRGEDYWTPEDVEIIVEEASYRVKESTHAVEYAVQNLTDTQKSQARSNISAASEIVTSASGDTITITDSSDQSLRGMKVFGKSTQKTTTGAQLLDFPEFDITYYGVTWRSKDGVVTVYGTASSEKNSTTRGGAIVELPIVAGRVYRVINPDEEINNIYDTLRIIKEDGEELYYRTNGRTYTVQGDEKSIELFLEVDKNKTVNAIVYPTIRLVNGEYVISDDLANYEPYTGGMPSPSPEYPQEIVSVGDSGSVGMKITGKNIFGGDALADRLVEVAQCSKDETAETIIIPGSAIKEKVIYSDFKPNTQYTFIFKASTAGNASLNMNIIYTDGTEKNMYASICTNGAVGTPVFVSDKGKSIECLIGAHYSATTLYYNECGIFEGVLTADDFVPYKPEQILTITTPNGLGGIQSNQTTANHTDANGIRWRCDILDFEKGIITSEKRTFVFKGTENIVLYGSSGIAYAFAPGYTLYTGLCTHYVPCKNNKEIGAENNTVYLSGSANVIFTDNRFVNDIDGFKAWLAEQYAAGTPVTVVGMRKNTPEIPLSEEELESYRAIHTNKPNTVVSNDSGAEMEVSYTVDTKTYIDNKFAELSAAILNNT